MFSPYANEAIDMFFVYHLNIFALFFISLLYFMSYNACMLWLKIKNISKIQVYFAFFIAGGVMLVLNFYPFVMQYLKRI